MKPILALLPLVLPAAVIASVPSGDEFGPWHVAGIGSTSGTALDDAAATLRQKSEAGEMRVSWHQGGPVVISINIDDCGDDGEDFERSYDMEPERWLTLGDRTGNRLRSDFAGWLDEARVDCGHARIDQFQLISVEAAAADFSRRVAVLSGRLNASR